jgi:peptidoglycan hydrolase CwlO-like protein
MKKTMILGAFASLLMVSCAKDYSCKCVTTESTTGATNTQTTVINGKKKDAQAACEAQSATVATVVKTCGLE